MTKAACSAEEFAHLYTTLGTAKLASYLGVDERRVRERRARVENELGYSLRLPTEPLSSKVRMQLDIEDGVVLIASDFHYWPGIISTGHRAFVKACQQLKPKVVIANGDVFDGASISRHPPIGWEHRPTVRDEIETCQDRLGEITVAAGSARRIWLLGNHDARFETRLASVAPDFALINGVHLRDHFPDWETGWSCFLNQDVVVKHRMRGGIHATHNNTVNAGKTMITGHLHSQKVSPFTDYNGTRWGVDTGCIADTFDPQFDGYMEDNPRNWRSGFAVLTFYKGRLLTPELVSVIGEGKVEFRGRVWDA